MSVNPIFPAWFDRLVKLLGVLAGLGVIHLVTVAYLGFTPRTTDVGYQPVQPVAYSHKRHAGELGIDCRYCHNTVETSAHASIPPTSTCMNCHKGIRSDDPQLELVRKSAETGEPIPWVRIHDLPDFVYFNHSAHVTRGVACVSCHGRVDRMEVVYQAEPLSMAWCLDCHRNFYPNLRPPPEVTNMEWVPEGGTAEEIGAWIARVLNINPRQDCSSCHR